ncbi:hypothetical protein Y032_0152g2865 [Ancylostoma ceylanicum]|uniref:SET domain-containing protein n=1 Tax=Ancylostoma ceylanicum TaxID=53326 RepID=A0A016T0W3_9BILA|nr:hypothetical protein Y032_0152g2865 [Ancylostoma ceylanicum]
MSTKSASTLSKRRKRNREALEASTSTACEHAELICAEPETTDDDSDLDLELGDYDEEEPIRVRERKRSEPSSAQNVSDNVEDEDEVEEGQDDDEEKQYIRGGSIYTPEGAARWCCIGPNVSVNRHDWNEFYKHREAKPIHVSVYGVNLEKTIHTCSANKQNQEGVILILRATRDIKVGEQLLWDYSSMYRGAKLRKYCICSACDPVLTAGSTTDLCEKIGSSADLEESERHQTNSPMPQQISRQRQEQQSTRRLLLSVAATANAVGLVASRDGYSSAEEAYKRGSVHKRHPETFCGAAPFPECGNRLCRLLNAAYSDAFAEGRFVMLILKQIRLDQNPLIIPFGQWSHKPRKPYRAKRYVENLFAWSPLILRMMTSLGHRFCRTGQRLIYVKGLDQVLISKDLSVAKLNRPCHIKSQDGGKSRS